MKKIASLVGLAVFFTFAGVGLDVSAAECRSGFADASGSDLRGEIGGTLQAACVDKDNFHVPAAVPLFLSAIAGLGIVALRGRVR
jgi:hypothetical protein